MEQLSLFNSPQEKGSREWSAFNTVLDDSNGMFRVATPLKQQPRYTNVVHIRRHSKPHQLFTKPAL